MNTITKHIFTAKSLSICFNSTEIDQWLEDNQIPYHMDALHEDIYKIHQVINLRRKLTDHEIESVLKYGLKGALYSTTDSGHIHAIHKPLLVYTLIDDESAILFKLQFGDYFDHEVKEQE